MASPPPGFDPTASALPDVSAPIHVMRGGGQKGGASDENTLKHFQLGPGQALEFELTDDEKSAFLKALADGCNTQLRSTVNSKCAPVVKVLKAMLKLKIKKENAAVSPGEQDVVVSMNETGGVPPENSGPNVEEGQMSSPNLLTMPGREAELANAMGVPPRGPGRKRWQNLYKEANENAGNEANSVATNNRNNALLVEEVVAPVKPSINYNPRSYRGNNSGALAPLGYNLTRKKMYANVRLGSRRARVYGNSKNNIQSKFNAEKAVLQRAANEALNLAAKTATAKQTAKLLRQNVQSELDRARREKMAAERRAYATARLAGQSVPLTSRLTRRLPIPTAEPKPSFFNRIKSAFSGKGGRRTRRVNRKASRKDRKNRK